MKTLIIYDSLYGNTEKVAHAIASGLRRTGAVEVLHVQAVTPAELASASLIIAGSPTHGGRPSPGMLEFLDQIPVGGLSGVRVAAFDTRFAPEGHGVGLKILMKTIGFAAGRIARSLSQAGGELLGEPEGFIVEDKKGPLKEGELERAARWSAALGSASALNV